MLSHVGRQVLGHFFQLRGDDQSPRLVQGSAVLASDVDKHHPRSREGVEMYLGLPRDGYRTIGHGGSERFDVDLAQRSEHVDGVPGGVYYPPEHVATSAAASGATKRPCRMYISTARGSCHYRIISLWRSLSTIPRCPPKKAPGGSAWSVHMGTHMGPQLGSGWW